MKRALGLSLCLLAVCGTSGSELRYEVLWTLAGKGGFSAPNALYEPRTAKPSFLVAAERDQGITAVTLDGKRLWEFPMEAPVSAAPAVADVNGDGHEEVVAVDSKGNLVVLDATGKELWRAHTPGGVCADSCPAVADLDGDGAPEIVVGDQSGTLSCFDHLGKLRWQFTGDGSQMGPVLIADIYDPPGLELIVTSHDQHVYALTARGEWLWDLYFPDDLFPYSTPILADVRRATESPSFTLAAASTIFTGSIWRRRRSPSPRMSICTSTARFKGRTSMAMGSPRSFLATRVALSGATAQRASSGRARSGTA